MQAIVSNNSDLINKYQSELQQYNGEVQSEVSEYQNKLQQQQLYSAESQKYYNWSKLEIKSYIENNSKLIAASMSKSRAER